MPLLPTLFSSVLRAERKVKTFSNLLCLGSGGRKKKTCLKETLELASGLKFQVKKARIRDIQIKNVPAKDWPVWPTYTEQNRRATVKSLAKAALTELDFLGPALRMRALNNASITPSVFCLTVQ